jgi:sugar lactone lactonase YvrE
LRTLPCSVPSERPSSLRHLVATAILAAACSVSSPAWSRSAQSLWIANSEEGTIVELLPDDLKQSGAPSPTIIRSAALLSDGVDGLAFDKSKDLWVSTFSPQNLVEFTPTQLANLNSVSNPVPTATIGSTAFNGINGCTLDKAGNLWVTDSNSVHELSRKQLSEGSNADITPAVTITSPSNFDILDFATFDKAGDLWVSSENNSKVLELSVDQLGSSGDKMPAVILSASGDSLKSPEQLAFDHKGNLWVANLEGPTLVMFAKSQLRETGTPTPMVTLSGSAIKEPRDLVFDKRKNLWMLDYDTEDILKFSARQLKKSGTPTPTITITDTTGQSNQMTFGPAF